MKKSLIALLAGLSLVGSSQAATFEITGATAFRTAAVTAINAAFNASGPFAYGFSNTSSAGAATTLTTGSYQIWRGTFPGLAGETIIRTSWNGSIEGIRAVAQPGGSNDAPYLLESLVTGLTLTAGGGTPVQRNFNVDVATAVADLSFSDAAQAATPIPGSLAGGPVGVVVFTMLANRTWADDSFASGPTSAISSVSAQQFRGLAQLGRVPLSFFTGNTLDTTSVYLTGRNDGSGTRTTYLAETGFGVSKPVRQYVVHDRSNTQDAPIILLTAAGGGFNFQNVATPGYRSTVWNQDVDGNGGYVSSGDLRDDMAKRTASTAVWEFFDGDFSGDYDASEDGQVTAAAKLYTLTWLTYSDARSARTSFGNTLASAATAKVLGYDGATLPSLTGDNPPATISAADRAKIISGQYAAWSFQQLLHLGNVNTTAIFNELKSRLNSASLIGSAGIPLGEMKVTRFGGDGGTIIPN